MGGLLFCVKNLSESYFLGSANYISTFLGSRNAELFSWVLSLRNREKYGLHTKPDLFFTNCG